MKTTKRQLRNTIRRILKEAAADVVSLGLRIKISDNISIEDVYTDIRGLMNVITVRQEGQFQDVPGPYRYVNIFVTFEDDSERDVYNLKRDIDALDGVSNTTIKNYEGQRWSELELGYTGGAASEEKK